MPITPEQRDERRNWIGASDVPAIMGQSPWAGPSDVYYQKVLTDADLGEEKSTPAQEQGNAFEEAIIRLALPRIGTDFPVSFSPPTFGPIEGVAFPIAANLDAVFHRLNTPEVIEAKRRGDTDEWGDEGTDEIPADVILQTQTQMAVLGWATDRNVEVAWVPVIMPVFRSIAHRLYVVRRNDALIEEIMAACGDFWERYVGPAKVALADEPDQATRFDIIRHFAPDDTPPPISVLKRLGRQPDSVTEWGIEEMALWSMREKLKTAAKRLKEMDDSVTARILASLGTCEGAMLPDGRMVTYLEQRSAPSVDHALMKAKYPEAHEECVTQGHHRTLRIKKAKKK